MSDQGRAVSPASIPTFAGVVLLLLALVFTFVRVVPFGVALALVLASLVAAVVARGVGRRQGEPFDGRLSLVVAMVAGVLTIYYALQVGLLVQLALAAT